MAQVLGLKITYAIARSNEDSLIHKTRKFKRFHFEIAPVWSSGEDSFLINLKEATGVRFPARELSDLEI